MDGACGCIDSVCKGRFVCTCFVGIQWADVGFSRLARVMMRRHSSFFTTCSRVSAAMECWGAAVSLHSALPCTLCFSLCAFDYLASLFWVSCQRQCATMSIVAALLAKECCAPILRYELYMHLTLQVDILVNLLDRTHHSTAEGVGIKPAPPLPIHSPIQK